MTPERREHLIRMAATLDSEAEAEGFELGLRTTDEHTDADVMAALRERRKFLSRAKRPAKV